MQEGGRFVVTEFAEYPHGCRRLPQDYSHCRSRVALAFLVCRSGKEVNVTSGLRVTTPGVGPARQCVTLPSVAVVIPAWNRLADTVECLESLGRSAYPSLHIIVVDNGSEVGFSETISAQFPDVTVVRSSTNLGFVGGTNLGIRKAFEIGSDYILLLNNDTIVEPEAIPLLVQTSQTCPAYKVFSPLITFASNPPTVWFAGGAWDRRRKVVSHLYFRDPIAAVPAQVYETDWANGCALFANRSVFETVGLLDPAFFALWEEVDWCFRASGLGFRCAIQPRARIMHKASATFGSNLTDYYIYLNTRNRLIFLAKHFGVARAFPRAVGQTVAAVRQLWRGLAMREPQQATRGLAMLQGSFDAVLRRTGQQRLWRGGSR